MKIAVVGGGSTYTPELVDGLGRLRDVAAGRGAGPRRPRPPTGSSWSARSAAGSSPGWATRPGSTTTTELAPALDGVDAVLLQLRVGGQAARHQDETWPLECGCVGQETTGAGGLAKALRTVPVVLDIAEQVRRGRARTPGSSTSPTRSASSPGPCCRPVTGRSGCATSRSASSAGSPGCLGVEPDRGAARPRRAQPPHLGARRPGWTASTGCPSCSTEHVDELADEHRAAGRACCAQLGVVPSYYLRYFYAHDEVVARAARPATSRAAAGRRRSSGELLELYADPALDEQAGAARAARRCVLLRGRRPAGRGAARQRRPTSTQVVNVRNDGTLPFLPDDAVIEVPAPRSTAPACAPLPVAPLDAAVRRTRRPRHGVRAPGPRGRPARRPRAGLRGPAGAPAGRPGRPRRRA